MALAKRTRRKVYTPAAHGEVVAAVSLGQTQPGLKMLLRDLARHGQPPELGSEKGVGRDETSRR